VASPQYLPHRPALVFDDLAQDRRRRQPRRDADHILTATGLQGGPPGMPEWGMLPIPQAGQQGVGDMRCA
jgi:hypothetical protein